MGEQDRVDVLAAELEETLAISLPCQRPVLVRNTATQDQISVRCGNRRRSACPPCAALYRGDVSALLRQGALDQGTGRFLWLTITAPSFGSVHSIPNAGSRWTQTKGHQCRCGTAHNAEDEYLRGVPLDPSSYDYDGQVRWNQQAPRLFSRTMDALSGCLGERLQYFKVAEFQYRGCVHFHVIARIADEAAVEYQLDRSGRKRASELEAVIRAAGIHPGGDRRSAQLSWGNQVIAEVIEVRHKENKTARRLLGYVAKILSYEVKDLDVDAKGPREHFARLRQAATGLRCARGTCSPGPANKCRAPLHRNIGFGGHVASRSRQWSKDTMTTLAARRVAWHAARDGHPDVLEATSDREAWSYVGQLRRADLYHLRMHIDSLVACALERAP